MTDLIEKKVQLWINYWGKLGHLIEDQVMFYGFENESLTNQSKRQAEINYPGTSFGFVKKEVSK